MKHLRLSLLLIALLALGSCSKESTPKSDSEKFVGVFICTSIKYSPPIDYNDDGVLITEAVNLRRPCFQDDCLVIKGDGTGYWDDAKVVCPEPKGDPFTWRYDEKNKLMIYTYVGSSEPDTSDILQVNDNGFVILGSESAGSQLHTVNTTWTRKK